MRNKMGLALAAVCTVVAFSATPVTALENDLNLTDLQLSIQEQEEFEAFLESEDQIEYQLEDIIVTDASEDDRTAALSRFKSRTSNPNVTFDERVGMLNVEGVQCTAGYIGKGFWVAAAHCVDGKLGGVGYVAQKNGRFAGIEGIWLPNPEHDVAIVKVGRGLNPPAFKLAGSHAKIGQRVTINGIGKGDNNMYNVHLPSQIDAIVESTEMSDRCGRSGKYVNLACANRVSEYHVLGGDSGAPVWTGNTIFGVMHGKTDQVVFTNISDDAKWIQNFADSYMFPSLGNLFRSWKGGKEAAKLFGRSELSG